MQAVLYSQLPVNVNRRFADDLWGMGSAAGLGLVCVMQATIFAGLHRIGHLANHRYTLPVLERPHTPWIEERRAVVVAQDVTQVWLEAGHGAQLTIDERDPTRLGRHIQVGQ